MSIADLSKALASKHEMPVDVARDLVVDVLQLIEKTTVARGRCAVRGFGVFKMQHFAAKPARNPRTGERVTAPARTRLVFKHASDRRAAAEQDRKAEADDGQMQLGLG
ncbi:MAG: HU family DNA-binding protein [Roseateles sp.]|nr:MAG: HU family DNA-binding protein [Roseateles sp.]